MKRNLFFVTASLLALSTSAAFADGNVVVLNQYDVSQHATIEQFNSGNSVGAYNGWSGFDQNNGGLAGSNVLSVSQTGTGNSVGRDTKGVQSGTGNSADIKQAGVSSDVELQQFGTSNGAVPTGWDWTNDSGVFNKIVQDSSSVSSKVSVVQNGENNVFSIKQGSISNNTSVTQTGKWAMAYVRQGLGAAETDGATSAQMPFGGNYNGVTISQNSAGLNYAVAVQGGGDSNSLGIYQNGDLLGANAWQEGAGNVFSSNQSGVGNTVGITGGIYGSDTPIKQKGNGNSYTSNQSGTNNTANGTQTGNVNFVLNNQGGANNSISGSQTNNNNNVTSSQFGSYSTLAYTQTNSGGGANYIVNIQNGAGTVGSRNTAVVNQSGFGQYSSGQQYGGDGNSANVTQSGSLQASYYVQNGAANTIVVAQTGVGNYSSLNQNGSGNNANITQK
ncbi:curlin [Rhodopseudomonas palustris]|uniref:curlin n=1 Tax=Rhodopseudomonas palustris TaxID=1076 RepID=UPI000D1A9396|nr:curlin [Rhodopseudomonas palustris]AVT75198.1 curlin [Rhodopseudomonas palustris]